MASDKPREPGAPRTSATYKTFNEEIAEEVMHIKIVSEKFRQVRTELISNLARERAKRKELEERLEHALQAEKWNMAQASKTLVSARDYILLDKMASQLREDKKKLKEEIEELKDRAKVEADIAAARQSAWERDAMEAQRRSELELQAVRDQAREACQSADKEKKALQEAFKRQSEELTLRHQEELAAQRAEVQSIRNECHEEVNLAALEFEERSAQLTDRLGALEAERHYLLEQISASNSQIEFLQSKVADLQRTQRSQASERSRLLEVNRALMLQQQQSMLAALRGPRPRGPAPPPRFQPASSLYSASTPSSAYPQLAMARQQRGGGPQSAPPDEEECSVEDFVGEHETTQSAIGVAPPAAPPAPLQPPPARPRRQRRKLFETDSVLTFQLNEDILPPRSTSSTVSRPTSSSTSSTVSRPTSISTSSTVFRPTSSSTFTSTSSLVSCTASSSTSCTVSTSATTSRSGSLQGTTPSTAGHETLSSRFTFKRPIFEARKRTLPSDARCFVPVDDQQSYAPRQSASLQHSVVVQQSVAPQQTTANQQSVTPQQSDSGKQPAEMTQTLAQSVPSRLFPESTQIPLTALVTVLPSGTEPSLAAPEPPSENEPQPAASPHLCSELITPVEQPSSAPAADVPPSDSEPTLLPANALPASPDLAAPPATELAAAPEPNQAAALQTLPSKPFPTPVAVKPAALEPSTSHVEVQPSASREPPAATLAVLQPVAAEPRTSTSAAVPKPRARRLFQSVDRPEETPIATPAAVQPGAPSAVPPAADAEVKTFEPADQHAAPARQSAALPAAATRAVKSKILPPSFMHHLAKLPASKMRWSVPISLAAPAADAPPPPPVPEVAGEEDMTCIETTRQYFHQRQRDLQLHRGVQPAAGEEQQQQPPASPSGSPARAEEVTVKNSEDVAEEATREEPIPQSTFENASQPPENLPAGESSSKIVDDALVEKKTEADLDCHPCRETSPETVRLESGPPVVPATPEKSLEIDDTAEIILSGPSARLELSKHVEKQGSLDLEALEREDRRRLEYKAATNDSGSPADLECSELPETTAGVDLKAPVREELSTPVLERTELEGKTEKAILERSERVESEVEDNAQTDIAERSELVGKTKADSTSTVLERSELEGDAETAILERPGLAGKTKADSTSTMLERSELEGNAETAILECPGLAGKTKADSTSTMLERSELEGNAETAILECPGLAEKTKAESTILEHSELEGNEETPVVDDALLNVALVSFPSSECHSTAAASQQLLAEASPGSGLTCSPPGPLEGSSSSSTSRALEGPACGSRGLEPLTAYPEQTPLPPSSACSGVSAGDISISYSPLSDSPDPECPGSDSPASGGGQHGATKDMPRVSMALHLLQDTYEIGCSQQGGSPQSDGRASASLQLESAARRDSNPSAMSPGAPPPAALAICPTPTSRPSEVMRRGLKRRRLWADATHKFEPEAEATGQTP